MASHRNLPSALFMLIMAGISAAVPSGSFRRVASPQARAGPLNGLLNSFYEKMQKATETMKKDLESAEYEGFSTDETVRVIVNGAQQPKLVDVTQAAVDQGAEKLEQLVVEASKDAYRVSKQGQEERMKKYFKDMGLPMPPNAKLPF
eukprot:jgi/Bigna1/138908/aug1.47_g13616